VIPLRLKLVSKKDNSRSKNDELILSYNSQQADFGQRCSVTFDKIEHVISLAEAKGELPLWDGYENVPEYTRSVGPGAKRKVSQVRTGKGICQFYAWLAWQKKPERILEFGAAFGASGLYWLAGIEEAKKGKLISFEPNPIWCKIARANFKQISKKFVLTEGTFEENIALVTPKAEITLIDAIHTKSFVLKQFELVKEVSSPGAIVIFDDINFSADMKECWQEVCNSDDAVAVWQIGNRVGLIELA
jgi:predicted O-methyltransferase YrrM